MEPHESRRRGVLSALSGGFSLSQLWLIVLPSAFFLFQLTRPLGFIDLGYHLRAGEWAWEHMRWMDHDVFTHTFEGRAWHNQNWLAQFLYHGIWRVLSYHGLVMLNTVLFSAGFALLLRICYGRTREARTACLVAFVSLVPAVANTGVRPQAFSWLFTIAVIYLLERSRAQPRSILWAIPLFALWANLHGAFPIAMVFMGIDAVVALLEERGSPGGRERLRYLLYAIVGSALVVLLNPWGWRVYAYVASVGGDPVVREWITEWAPPEFKFSYDGFFFGTVVLLGALLARSSKRLDTADLLRVGVFFLLALLAIRNILWWSIALAPALATLSEPLARRWDHLAEAERPSRLNSGFALALVILAVAMSPWIRPKMEGLELPLIDETTPTKAAAYLERNDLPGEMLNHQKFGSYFEWAIPNRPVFIDSRIEVFPDGLFEDYNEVFSVEREWRDVVDEYGIGHIVFEKRSERDLYKLLDGSDEWEKVFEDRNASIFVRE